MNLIVNDTYDLICLITAIIGVILLVVQLYLNDWDIKKLMFNE